jgi:hypothetical protein
LRFEYIQARAGKSEIALYCRILKVTPQGYAKYLKAQSRPYKYAELLANIKAILLRFNFKYVIANIFLAVRNMQIDENKCYFILHIKSICYSGGHFQQDLWKTAYVREIAARL